jgi:hypothetical protein
MILDEAAPQVHNEAADWADFSEITAGLGKSRDDPRFG